MAEKWTEQRMQDALTRRGNLFDFTRYSVVPNVSYAVLSNGEADLLCLSGSGVFHEVEIKVSKSDLIADKKKRRGHENRLVAYTWFAVPVELESVALQHVPERFGIVVVEHWPNPHGYAWMAGRTQTRVVRKARKWTQPGSRKPSDTEVIRFLRTGVIRMWSRRTGVEA
jgi:hypothetical protein